MPGWGGGGATFLLPDIYHFKYRLPLSHRPPPVPQHPLFTLTPLSHLCFAQAAISGLQQFCIRCPQVLMWQPLCTHHHKSYHLLYKADKFSTLSTGVEVEGRRAQENVPYLPIKALNQLAGRKDIRRLDWRQNLYTPCYFFGKISMWSSKQLTYKRSSGI